MKKDNYKFLILPVLILLYLGYTQYISNQESSIVLYKQGYTNDCANVKKKPKDILVLTKTINKNKLTPNKLDLNVDFEQSKCVDMTSLSYKNYLVLSDFVIDHEQGKNDLAYQVSYEKVLDTLKSKSNHSDFDKQIIKSLEFYIKDNDYSQLVPKTANKKDIYQTNQAIIGPDSNDESGKYVMVVDLNVVKNDINKVDKNKKKQLDTTEYVFNSLTMKYVKVGE